MKKLTRMGALLFSLGVLLFMIALATCDWDVTKISTKPAYHEQQYSIENKNQAIVLEDKKVPLTVGVSSDDEIHFIYYENEKEHYDIDQGDELTIEKKTNFHWYDHFFSINFQNTTFTILLPSDFDGTLEIQTSDAEVSIQNVTAERLEVTTSSEAVSINNVSTVQDMTVTTSDARIEVQDLSAEGDISLTTSNGSISGNILGRLEQFTIQSNTPNGKNNLPESSLGGRQKLEVRTSDADISLDFSE